MSEGTLFILFMIIHVLGDYYLQTEKLTEEKERRFIKLLQHGLIYLIIAQIGIIPIWSVRMMLYTIGFALIHLCIDMFKYSLHKIVRKNKSGKLTEFLRNEAEKGRIYVADQIAHIISIYIFCHIVINYIDPINILGFFNGMNVYQTSTLQTILMFLLVLKPVNVTFKVLLNKYKPLEGNTENKNVGQLIGNLERLLVIILLFANQYTAIGLVFTAKSISRYDKISSDKQFAEYYLLGTLFSMLATVVIFYLVGGMFL